jgi:hypothetical protein
MNLPPHDKSVPPSSKTQVDAQDYPISIDLLPEAGTSAKKVTEAI